MLQLFIFIIIIRQLTFFSFLYSVTTFCFSYYWLIINVFVLALYCLINLWAMLFNMMIYVFNASYACIIGLRFASFIK